MMAEEHNILDIAEQSVISKALVLLFNKYPDLPVDHVEFNYVGDDGVGILPMKGSYYIEEFISGSFKAQYPFQIIYSSKPSTSNKRIDRQNIVDLMAEWAENPAIYPLLNGSRTIEEIKRTSTANMIYRDDTGNEKYQITMNLVYRKDV